MRIFDYLTGGITRYLQRKEAEEFARDMEEVKVEADRILSLGDFVRKEFARPEAWRL